MDKQFNPHTIEQKWYQHWEKNNLFAPSGQGDAYCIMLPPPNVTGSLHMGHGFQQTLMDILIRYHRMSGNNTLWQPGTDHAGIATQMVVERQLQQLGIERHQMGREAFIEKVWQWKQQSGDNICQQMRRLGASAYWPNQQFTMDPGMSEAVSKVFIELYEQGLIYRGKRLVNWDPKLLTAISDLEVEQHEEMGTIWFIRYPVFNTNDMISIATTRPETLLGDVAVAVHPKDPRYQNLIGQQVQLPITGRLVPVIADEYVDPEFGSGCVKITPAHDFNDYEIGKRHGLPMINIFHPNATLNDSVPEDYRGLDRFVARKKILQELTETGWLEKEKTYQRTVPRGDRSGEVIEPYLTDQWFVKVKTLAEPAIKVVEQGKITFHPKVWTKTYYQWMHNIEDWCISRQLWWGHRIPAWYDDNGNVYVAETAEAVRQKYHLDQSTNLTQEDDVLDTWFSSALWPFSTLGWPDQDSELLNTFYPSSLLISGFDIIFFWIARMIMFGIKFQKQIPFKDVYITGLIRDNEGQKMSKTKGNVIDPIDLIDGIELDQLIEKRTSGLMQPKKAQQIANATKKQFPNGISSYGTDALRFTYCALASFNRELRFDMTRMDSHRHFCNKIWNAARYVLMNTEYQDVYQPSRNTYHTVDRWIWSRLQKMIELTDQHIKNYRFDLLAKQLYEFVWNEYCDWYLELTKPILADELPHIQHATRYSLVKILELTLRLLHPIIPFITEEIWQQVAPKIGIQAETISNQSYPTVEQQWLDTDSEQKVEWLKQIITGIRSIRSEMNIAPSKHIKLILQHGSSEDHQQIADNEKFLQTLVKISSIEWLSNDAKPPISATCVVGTLQLLIPLAGLVDKNAEIARLNKAIAKLEKDLQVINQKLGNEHFVAKAPENLVHAERENQQAMSYQLTVLQKKIEQIKTID